MIERMHARSGPTSYPTSLLRVGSLRCCNPLDDFARDRAHLPGLYLWGFSEQCGLASMNTPALPGRRWQKIKVSSKSCRRGPCRNRIASYPTVVDSRNVHWKPKTCVAA